MVQNLLLRPSGYYFRYIIRPCHRPLLSIKELRYTLGTSSRRMANKRARAVAARIAAVIASHWKDLPFVYSCNKTVHNQSGKSISNPMKKGLATTAHGKHIKTISHGSNSYDRYSRLASLAVTQPNTALIQRVAELGGISPDVCRLMYWLHTVYQTVGRCAVRKNSQAQRFVSAMEPAGAGAYISVAYIPYAGVSIAF